MTTHAYSPLYLSKASRAVGNMLHDAVVEFGMDGEDFLKRFIQSDVAEEIESGNPKYIAGKSGLELFLEVMEKTTGKAYDTNLIESYEVLNAHFEKSESKLKTARKHCGLTQEELARESGVSLNTIRAYERKGKDINKAQFDIVLRLAKALKCDITELLD